MGISVFLSRPNPYLKRQQQFLDEISSYLHERGLEPRTLGVTDYDLDAPLTAIRRLMLESNGLITIAFRRTSIIEAISKPESDLNQRSSNLSKQWLTSPWAHIEPAMAFQLGLPILIIRELGVVEDGILEKGVTGLYLPAFDLNKDIQLYLQHPQWTQIIGKFEGQVRKVLDNKGKPPCLY